MHTGFTGKLNRPVKNRCRRVSCRSKAAGAVELWVARPALNGRDDDDLRAPTLSADRFYGRSPVRNSVPNAQCAYTGTYRFGHTSPRLIGFSVGPPPRRTPAFSLLIRILLFWNGPNGSRVCWLRAITLQRLRRKRSTTSREKKRNTKRNRDSNNITYVRSRCSNVLPACMPMYAGC